ncbi:MAG: methylmalonyl-CoA mutase family protein [Bacteroidales bacterium]|jgi:methylmalonyl-CoA mutase|nr:methylmalonyl-CoA mutase family protein [Bacteroidales bacterium]
MSDKKLFSEFPPVTTAQWEEQITLDLKGANYEKKLVWRTNEGFPVQPYYRSENLAGLEYLDVLPGQFPYVRGNKDTNNWQVCQDMCIRDAKQTNAKALDAIGRGADAIGFSVCGKGVEHNIDIPALMKDICCGCTPVHFDAGVSSVSVLEAVLQDAVNKKCGAHGVRGSVFYDPLGRLAVCGCFYGNREFPADTVKKLLELVKSLGEYRVIGVDAAHFQNSGANLVQELAYALAMGSEYLSLMTADGYQTADVAKRMHFRFAIGSNYFMEIAKLRAARLLWANIVKAYDPACGDAAYMYIHGETADWNMTVYDPYVNLLRTTTEAMSGAIAGVDSLWVRPFDSAYRRPDVFSERIARNQQIILKEEAYMSQIVDPSAGSYYIENLTASIADNAWKLFLETEDKGGYIAAMKKGFIQGQVEESAAKRRAAIASRREALLGTNQYANTAEFMNDRINDYRCANSCSNDKIAEPLTEFRLGEAFEELRLKTERSGRRPKVFLLTIGSLAMRKARAGFALNFFSVAGFEVLDNNGFATVEEGVEAAVKAKADIIVLCSSDDEYPALAPQAVAAAKGKGILALAGFPKAIVDELKAAGIENFIYAGQNVLEALDGYRKMLGI